MRPIASAAILTLLLSGPVQAQFPLGWGLAPGGILVVPGRPCSPHGYFRGSHATPSITIIINAAPGLVGSNGVPPDVARFVSRLPQFPPPSEREILANVPRPATILPPEPIPKPDFAALPPLLAPPPAADKNQESDRQVRLGRESFAAGQVGRAAEQFQQAINAAPKRPLPYFLLAQAQFAVGRYREAAASIVAGLKLDPNWPAAAFNPRDLYGGNVAELALDIEQLREAAERNPAEPALSFLYGYELWLNGRRDEARKYFKRALPNAADPAPIGLFLNPPAAPDR